MDAHQEMIAAMQGDEPTDQEPIALLQRRVREQREIIDEVHSWIVCACIANAEDMMQSAERIAEITSPDYSAS
jgi:hypothetical protein